MDSYDQSRNAFVPAFPTRKRSSFRRVSRVDVINPLQLPTLQGRRQFRAKLLQLPQPLLRRRHLLLLPNKYFAFPPLQLHTEIPVHHQGGGSQQPQPAILNRRQYRHVFSPMHAQGAFIRRNRNRPESRLKQALERLHLQLCQLNHPPKLYTSPPGPFVISEGLATVFPSAATATSSKNKNGATVVAPSDSILEFCSRCSLYPGGYSTPPLSPPRSSPPIAPGSPAASGSTHPSTHGSS